MNRLGRAAVIAALATVCVRLLVSGDFGRYVQQRMRWPLILAALVLIGFALQESLRAAREERHDIETRRQPAAPRVGWLLLAPAAVVVAVVPGGLGAAAANRVDAYTATDRTDVFAPLDASDGPVELRMIDFIDRAVWDPQRSLADVEVRLTGIVVNHPDLPAGFRLTRFLVSCCAADGIPLQIEVSGLQRSIPDDTWVVATVVWQPPDPDVGLGSTDPIRATLVELHVLPGAPSDPYESPF